MSRSAHDRFDADPSAYAEYLRSPLGRLRSELAWRNLQHHLPPSRARPPRALDVGAGTGETALRLAEAGWSVTLVDGSRRMLERAAEAAEARGLAARVACRAIDLDAGGLTDAVGAAYDLVVCHDVLEYVASPVGLLREARAALATTGRLSLVVRNLAGEVMKRLLRGSDPEAALEPLAARRVREDLYGLDVRLFDRDELGGLLGAAGLEALAELGVRVIADHREDWAGGGDDAFERMLELERRLGEDPGLRAVARYVQVIAAVAVGSEGR